MRALTTSAPQVHSDPTRTPVAILVACPHPCHLHLLWTPSRSTRPVPSTPPLPVAPLSRLSSTTTVTPSLKHWFHKSTSQPLLQDPRANQVAPHLVASLVEETCPSHNAWGPPTRQYNLALPAATHALSPPRVTAAPQAGLPSPDPLPTRTPPFNVFTTAEAQTHPSWSKRSTPSSPPSTPTVMWWRGSGLS